MGKSGSLMRRYAVAAGLSVTAGAIAIGSGAAAVAAGSPTVPSRVQHQHVGRARQPVQTG